MFRLFGIALITITVWIAILPYIIPKKTRNIYSDTQLREIALGRGMKPIPKDYKSFLKLLDSKDNPITKEKVQLGKKLFFDKILSSDKSISCASCHLLSKNPHDKKQFFSDITHPKDKTNCMVCHIKDESGSDRLSTAIGVGGANDPNHLNTLTILNSALAKYKMWDGSIKTSKDVVGEMIQDKFKMNLTSKEVVERLKKDTFYRQKFKDIFDDGVIFENVKKAIDVYQKTLLTRSPYDRFLEGDDDAISSEAKRGLQDFIDLGCKGCHTGITVGGQTMQRFPVRNYGFFELVGKFSKKYMGSPTNVFDINMISSQTYPFEDKGEYRGRDKMQIFRVPILRNVTKTSPYFHNGMVFDIRRAVFIMGKYQLGFELNDNQIDEIVAFLKSLEGNVVDYKELR
jgi:cytochrome c peroxidase